MCFNICMSDHILVNMMHVNRELSSIEIFIYFRSSKPLFDILDLNYCTKFSTHEIYFY